MTEAHFDKAEELIKKFNIPGDEPYCRVVPLRDRKVGFSIQTKYPPDIRFFPPKNKRGEDDTVALIHVLYAHPEEIKDEYDSHKVPIIVRIGPHSRYRENHFDYDFSDTNCPTKESIDKSKQTTWPIALDYDNEFFYDHHTETFIDKHHEPIEGLDILERVFREHCDTTHLLYGLSIRLKLRSQKRLSAILGFLVDILMLIQKEFFGRVLDENTEISKSYTGYRKEDFKKLSTESLNIFGYRASKSVIIIFCFLTVVLYSVKYKYGIDSKYLTSIFSNSFLTLTHSILTIWILDILLPNIGFLLINLLINLRARVIFRRFEK